jgi:hypothetical protein
MLFIVLQTDVARHRARQADIVRRLLQGGTGL